MKKTMKIGLIIFSIICVIGLGIIYLAHYLTVNSDAYPTLIERIYEDKEVQEITGGVEGIKFFSKSYKGITYGSGIGDEASYSLKVDGLNKDARIKAYLETDSIGDWQILKFNVKE